MNRKNKLMICLLSTGIVLFCLIQFWIIPSNQKKQAEYTRKQMDSLTHDISVIEKYRTAYVGNASNVSNLFENLPLYNISKKYKINSEDCTLTVNYLDTVESIGKEKVQRDLIYNTAAAMAAIDNLLGITYHFSGESYTFTRNQIEDVFDSPLSNLLSQEVWNQEVQNKLNNTHFVEQFYQ